MDIGVIAKAVEVACRAPSLHNSQPWRWLASSTAVDLLVDPRRVMRSADSAGREALIGCGAATFMIETRRRVLEEVSP